MFRLSCLLLFPLFISARYVPMSLWPYVRLQGFSREPETRNSIPLIEPITQLVHQVFNTQAFKRISPTRSIPSPSDNWEKLGFAW